MLRRAPNAQDVSFRQTRSGCDGRNERLKHRRQRLRTAGAFVVQIAAVSREEDAAALAGALRKKSYSVFVVNNPAAHDKFYHVQVGPFATQQDADAMKVRLTGEGYNPIVKHS